MLAGLDESAAMFFIVSKIFWFIAAPTNFLLLLAGLGLALLFTSWRGTGRALAAIGILGLVLCGASPLPRLLVRPLEDRFPRVDDDRTPIHGIIVLGGAIGISRGGIELNQAAERMTESLRLAQLHPAAKLVFSGGSLNLVSQSRWTEAGQAGQFYRGLGVAPERLILEDKSRNTYENALFTARLIQPKPGERWVLVTSAYHMPRAMGLFRKLGVKLEAYPVDYRSSGSWSSDLRPNTRLSRALELTDDVAKEWIGLLAYRLSGFTDALFPKPE